MGAKLIGIRENYSRPRQRRSRCQKCDKIRVTRSGDSKPTQCLFLADDGSLKWVGVNAGVFPGRWSLKDPDQLGLVFPPFPTGSWNVGQIRRFENGEVGFTKTLEIPYDGIENAWHPTKIEFAEFELLGQFDRDMEGRLWHVKHPRFNEKPIFVKLAPWASSWSKEVMEDETRAYQLVDGHGIAPEFLGHVTYRGAIIGFILEWIEGAELTTKKDKSARIKVVKKLHALGATHGSAHHANFLRRGKDVLMIDFESSLFGDQATEKKKEADIRRIKNIEGDMFEVVVSSDDDLEDESTPYVSNFFDPMVDDEINWTDDSEAAESGSENGSQEDRSTRCSCPATLVHQGSVE